MEEPGLAGQASNIDHIICYTEQRLRQTCEAEEWIWWILELGVAQEEEGLEHEC